MKNSLMSHGLGAGVLALAAGLANDAAAQTKLVGWGPVRFDSSWSEQSYVDVEVGPTTTVARRADGTFVSWGYYGAPFQAGPTLPAGVTCLDYAVTYYDAAARLSDGTVRTWPSGQTISYPSPIVQIDGDGHYLVLLADGTVRGFGGPNNYGETFQQPGNDFVEVAAAVGRSLARRSDGTLHMWGEFTAPPPPTPGLSFVDIDAGRYVNYGILSDGSLLQWDPVDGSPIGGVPPLPPGTTYVKVAPGYQHTLALRSDGMVVAWGLDQAGELAVPPLPAGTTYVDVSASSTYAYVQLFYGISAALRSDGVLVQFGWNGHGQLNAPPAPAGTEYVEISASDRSSSIDYVTRGHTVARKSDGTVVVFGDLTYGRANVPPLPAGVVYTDVDAGGLFSVALRSDGRIVDWGDNQWGQLNGTPASADFVAVTAGMSQSHALRNDGTIATWGFHASQLLPPPLPPGVTYVEVDAGTVHGVARRSDGTVVAWGENQYGQTNVPPLPAGVTYVDVVAGDFHNLARRSDGVVVAWGLNSAGESNVPPPPAGTTYVAITAGYRFSAALRSDGGISVWGAPDGDKLNVPALAPGQRYVAVEAAVEGLVAIADTVWAPYGVGKTNSLGCVPSIRAWGTPSASQTSGFAVECENVKNQALGMLIYTVNGARASTPFQCASLLVGPTGVRRTPIRSAHGNPAPPADCSGVFSLDMNAYAAGLAGGSPHAALAVAGTVVHAQWWGRDNGFAPPCNTLLSNAIEYAVGP